MLHIGFSRLYLGVHSVADLGGGLVGGALSVLIFTRLLEPLDAAAVAAVGTHPLAGGAALIVDYGDWRSLGDTLQALQNHATTDPFANPGEADITAHVDFEAIAMAAASTNGGAIYTRLTPQGVFLERLGIA